MPLMIQKFGGSSLKDLEHLKRVAGIVAKARQEGYQLVIVVSAQGNTTNQLLEKAKEIAQNANKREIDMLLSAGEQMSAALLTMTLQEMGYSAISLTGWQAGIDTDAVYTNAKIQQIDTKRIQAELLQHHIVVVAGFQGKNHLQDITTLGRGGSDTSAVALAAALQADICRIYTDVAGVYTADPNQIANAKKLDEIDFDEMLVLARFGAKVLHPRSVEIAKKYNICVEVRSSFMDDRGTFVKSYVKGDNITGIVKEEEVALACISTKVASQSMFCQAYRLLKENRISLQGVYHLQQPFGQSTFFYLVSKEQARTTKRLLQNSFSHEDIFIDYQVAKITLVGKNLWNNPQTLKQLLLRLEQSHTFQYIIAFDSLSISFLVPQEDVNTIMQQLHDCFFVQEVTG